MTTMTTHYNPDTLSLTVNITDKDVTTFRDEPGKFIGAARLQMACLVADKVITGFYLYESEFLQAWERIQKIPDKVPLTLLVAVGFPPEHEVSLTRNLSQIGYLLDLSIPAGSPFANKSQWLSARLKQICKEAGESVQLNEADITSALLQAKESQTSVSKFPVNLAPIRVPEVYNQPFLIKVRRDCGHIEIHMGESTKAYRGREKALIEATRAKVQELISRPGSSGYYRIYEDNISHAVNDIDKGYYALGMNLPHVQLAALELPCHTIRNHSFASDLFFCKNTISIPRDGHKEDKAPSGQLQFSRIKRWTPSLLPYYQGYLKAALGSLGQTKAKERNHQSMVVAIDDITADKIKTQIESLLDSMDQLASDDPDSILVTGIQWLPLTRTKLNRPRGKGENQPIPMGVWQKTILREIVGLDTFKNDAHWIQAKMILPLTLAEIKLGMNALREAGFIYEDPARGNRLIQSEKNIMTGDEADGHFLSQYHKEVLKIANYVLSHGNPERCSSWAAFHAIRKSDFALFQKEIYKYLSDIFSESGNALIPDQLYILNLQSFISVE